MVAESEADLPALSGEIESIIAESNTEFGVCIRHIESGAEIMVNPDSLYPLASVFKVPVLIEALSQVDEGRISLRDRHTLRHEDKPLGSGVLADLDPGLQPTLHDLLTLMIIVSDNTATDMVLNVVGRENVHRRMKTLGLEGISVRLTVHELFDTSFPAPEGYPTISAFWTEVTAQGPLIDPLTGEPNQQVKAFRQQGPNWDSIPGKRTMENNVASPRGMAQLFERLIGADLLSPESTRVGLTILLRQQLNGRIPRFLPMSVPIAHKTGTFMNTRNDAGVLYLPDHTHLIVVTFALLDREVLQGDEAASTVYVDQVDAAMGRMARAAYDAFAAGTDAS